MNVPAISLANTNQDLRYSYLCLKEAVARADGRLKYAIIGLSPYSFHYDLSASVNKWDALAYYPTFRDLDKLPLSRFAANSLFSDEFMNVYAKDTFEPGGDFDLNNPFNIRQANNRPMTFENVVGARAEAESWAKVDDDQIINNNAQIFIDCLKLCRDNNIKPLVMTFPVFENYRRFFPQEVMNRFRVVIDATQKEVPFNFLDYYKMELNPQAFFNAECLNFAGARFISQSVNNLLNKWDSGKINIAFIMQAADTWSKTKPVYEKFRTRDDVDLYGLVTPGYENYDLGVRPFGKYGDEYEYFHDLYDNDDRITLIDVADANGNVMELEYLHFDYVFYPRPYKELLGANLQCSHVSNFAKPCYIPYAPSFTLDVVLYAVQNWYFFGYVYAAFMSARADEIYLRSNYKTGNEDDTQHFVFLGNPEIETNFLKLRKMRQSRQSKQPALLWTPRWTYDAKVGGSHFIEYKDKFVAIRSKYKDVDMTIRPHPLTFPTMIKERRMTAQEVEDYKAALKSNDIVLDEQADFVQTFSHTDILITDFSSIIATFFFTGKPIIYCNSNYEFLSDYDTMPEGMYIANDWTEVEKYLDMLLSGKDPMFETRKKIIAQIMERHIGAADRIVDFIVEDYRKTSK